MVSSCMMRKVKKPRIVEAQKSPKENGEFMQLRSRRLYKSADVSMEALKKRQLKGVSFNSLSSNSESKVKGKKKNGSGLKIKMAEEREEMVVVEKEEDKVEENVEQIVEVNESVCFNERGVGEFDPIDFGTPANKAGGDSNIEIEGVDVDADPISDGIDVEEGEKGIVGDNLVPNDREIRESTPEHLIMRPGYMIAKGSSTVAPRGDVPACGPSTNRRLQGGCVSEKSIEDLFAASERQQEKLFMEKYNFDFKNESPLPGQYEWVKVEP